jgi:type 1 fimbria pilin
MKVKLKYRQFFLLLGLLICMTSYGQRINFSTWAGTSIVVQPVSVSTLDFGNMIIGSGFSNTISLTNATAFEIIAPENYDVTTTIDAPSVLDGPGGNTIPFASKMAWSNQGAPNATLANKIAVEVPSGFTSVSFPIRKNASGLPGAPPNPLDGTTTTRITAKAYVFIYGSAGPAPGGITAGSYTGTITITVEYVSN